MEYKEKLDKMRHYVINLSSMAQSVLISGYDAEKFRKELADKLTELKPEGDIVKCLELVNKSPWKTSADITAFYEEYEKLN